EPLDRYMAFLTVAGDEATGLHFGLYNVETGDVETQNFASLQYETNAVVGGFDNPYVVSFRGNTGLDEWTHNVNLFPNPVARGEIVNLGMTEVETLRATSVEIINAMGVVAKTQGRASLQTVTAPKVAGVYTLRITVEGKGVCYRKLVVE
ncbi:MAG: T9SS type A sorting domain-containing protein, partial [Bacteroidales bacterium]|nr:T9SS type A sorting domain-containing protein [Bacteroidales bacterium]